MDIRKKNNCTMSDQVLEHIFKEDCRISIADICKAHMEKALV